jgi:hypothetical protein
MYICMCICILKQKLYTYMYIYIYYIHVYHAQEGFSIHVESVSVRFVLLSDILAMDWTKCPCK